jgi:adenylate cyclase
LLSSDRRIAGESEYLSGDMTAKWDIATVRARLRLGSGLIMLAFVTMHLFSHVTLLISSERADATITLLMEPWRTVPGTALLFAAFLVHYANALWSIYARRSLRMPRWEMWQLLLGLAIPFLLTMHVIGTRVSELTLDTHPFYSSTLLTMWHAAPWVGVLQTAALIVVWAHACIGVHFWLRTKPWYRDWIVPFRAFAVLLPTLALAGFVAAGNQTLRDVANNPDHIKTVRQNANASPEKTAIVQQTTLIVLSVHVGLVGFAFGARAVRGWLYRRRRPPILSHANGRQLTILPGATVLETLRDNGVPHASVCGGRARCTTCRVMVTKGLDALPEPQAQELAALDRIKASAGTRLACQIRPTEDIAIMPLFAADAHAADGHVRGGLEGSERPITVVFVDLRGSTTIGEARLPYDVLYLLNRFFGEMTRALIATNGHYSQFTGDGLMALYGLNESDPAKGAADALRGAREMLARLERLNRQLRNEMSQPLKIGIGIHHSEAIVGAMGPPKSQIISAIGDTVNTCARLESLTKEFDVPVIVSRQAAEAAGLDVGGRKLNEVPVKGRVAKVEFYALETVPGLSA